MNKKYLIVLLCLMLPGVVVAGEICGANGKSIPASTPTDQFEFTASDAFATDKKTGLMWARCPWGYSLSELTGCSIDPDVLSDADVSGPDLNWPSALTVTNNVTNSYLGLTGWRMPNVKELASIVERKCGGLALNHEVFGDKAVGKYWTNTHVVNNTATSIRIINFSGGSLESALSSNELIFRLVRDVTP